MDYRSSSSNYVPEHELPHDSITEPRRVFDSEKVEQGNTQVSVQSEGYYDQAGFHELSGTYKSSINNTQPVFDYPSRKTHIFLSFLVDWIILACLLVLLSLWWAKPPTFYFRLDDDWIGYPLVEETVSATTIVLLIVLGPIIVVTIAQIWVRSFRDWHQSILSTLTLFASTQVVCTFMWALVGGLRPDFLAFCQPDITKGSPLTAYPGSPLVYYSDDICTCNEPDLIRAKHSFPSGHAAGITAVCIFLSIYISAKLKLYDNRSHLWKFCFVIFFMVIDVWISFSRVRDGRHHFRDVVVGMIIGAIIAPLVYRLNFCSLWGPDNHIPTRYTWRGRFAPFPLLSNVFGRHSSKRDDAPYAPHVGKENEYSDPTAQIPTRVFAAQNMQHPTQFYATHGVTPSTPSFASSPYPPPAPYPQTPKLVAPHTPNLPPLPLTPNTEAPSYHR